MNVLDLSGFLNELPDDMIVSAYQRRLSPHAVEKPVSSDRTVTEKRAEASVKHPPRWITAAALAACMLFAVGVGALMLRGQQDDLTTQSSQEDSSVSESVTSALTETTAVTGISGSTVITAASVTQQTETTYADVTQETATGTEQPDESTLETEREETVQTTAASETRQTDYHALIGHNPGGVYLYVGEEPDYSNLELTLSLENAAGDTAYQAEVFTVGSGKYANLYTLDTREVNPNVPGTYHIYVEANIGAEADFYYSDRDIPQIGLTQGPVHVTTDWSRNVFQVHVWDDNTGLMIGRGQMTSCPEINIPDDGSEQMCTLYNLREGHDGTVYEFDDSTVAEITEKHTDPSGLNQVFSIRGLRIGSAKLTVTAPDGRTAECIIHVTHIGF